LPFAGRISIYGVQRLAIGTRGKMSTIDARPTLLAADDDPYIWLEDIEGEAALAWVAGQNARTLARFGGARFKADTDTLTAIFDRPDNIPYVTRRGGLLYNFWQDAEHPRGLWRRTTLAAFVTDRPDWETLLDLDALAAAEGEDWVWGGSSTLPPDHHRAILRLSRGGSDAVVLREFDLTRKAFVEGGFTLPQAKGATDWLDADTLLLSSAYGSEAMVTRSGYARTVRLWRRGEDPLDAPVGFEIGAGGIRAAAGLDRTAASERVVFYDQFDFFDKNVWIGDRSGRKAKLDLPTDAWVDFHRDVVLVKTRTPWTAGGVTYAADTLLAGEIADVLAGAPEFHVLFEPAERITLKSFFWAEERLLLSIYDNLRPRYEVFTRDLSGWKGRRFEGLPEAGVVSAWRLDMEETESNGDILVSSQDPLTPPTFSLFPKAGTPALLKRAPAVFDASGLTITQHEAISVDGERIPYVHVGPAAETGDAPVLMTGYGGFAIPREPVYNSAVGKLWLEPAAHMF
jgi:prolyl oligopeptidase